MAGRQTSGHCLSAVLQGNHQGISEIDANVKSLKKIIF
jgi:hypothetical protein